MNDLVKVNMDLVAKAYLNFVDTYFKNDEKIQYRAGRGDYFWTFIANDKPHYDNELKMWLLKPQAAHWVTFLAGPHHYVFAKIMEINGHDPYTPCQLF